MRLCCAGRRVRPHAERKMEAVFAVPFYAEGKFSFPSRQGWASARKSAFCAVRVAAASKRAARGELPGACDARTARWAVPRRGRRGRIYNCACSGLAALAARRAALPGAEGAGPAKAEERPQNVASRQDAWVEMISGPPSVFCAIRSRPARDARAEIQTSHCHSPSRQSRPVRGAWVEIQPSHSHSPSQQSRPVRGAWVEIQLTTRRSRTAVVAPRKGRVDRNNWQNVWLITGEFVASCKGRVGRNRVRVRGKR